MNHMKALIAQFEQQKILVVGDVMIDTYQIGRVDRISPEAPVPVVLLKEKQNRLGGAANVALNIASLGGEVILCSVIGQDENGALFRQVMIEQNLDIQGIVTSSERKTTTKSRIFASGQQLLRLDEEDSHDLSQDEEMAFLQQLYVLLDEHTIDVILFQDYNKGVLTTNIIKKLIKYAQENGIQTVVDPKQKNFFAYEGVTLFKPNLKEISESMGQDIVPTQAGLEGVVGDLRQRLGCDYVLVTLSEKGIYSKGPESSLLMPTQTKSVADVSGAGDTVISVLALGLACEAKMEDMLAISNKAAGIVCAKLGVVPITSEELKK